MLLQRNNHSATRSRAAVMTLLVLALACVWPYRAEAQALPPFQWVYSPISLASGIAYSPDGTLLAVGGTGGVQILKASTGALLTCLHTTAATVTSVAFSPDGKTLAVGGGTIDVTGNWNGGVAELWLVSGWRRINVLPTIASVVISSVTFSPDGSMVADGGHGGPTGGVLETWAVSTGKPIATLATAADAGVSSVVFSPDGKTIADGGGSFKSGAGVLELWTVSTGKLLSTLTANCTGISSVGYAPDGQVLAVGGESATGGVLELWNVSTASLTSSLKTKANLYISTVAFSPDGSTVADGGDSSNGGVLELWNVSTGKMVSSLAIGVDLVFSVAFSPDGKTLADGGQNNDTAAGALEFWDLATGTSIGSPETFPNGYTKAVAISPNGNTLVQGGVTYDDAGPVGDIELWNVSTGKVTGILSPTANNIVYTVSFSPNGKMLADGGAIYDSATGNISGGALELWDISTGKLVRTLNGSASFIVNSVAFSPDGTMIAAGGATANSAGTITGGVLKLWLVSTGALLETFSTGAQSGVASVAFSPDGSTIAAGGSVTNGTVAGVLEMWNASSGALIKSLNTTAGGGVTCVAFSRDGSTLADGTSNTLSQGLIEVWDVAKGTPDTPFTLLPGTHMVNSLAYSHDGKSLLAGADLTIQEFSASSRVMYRRYIKLSGSIPSLALSPSGSLFAYAASSGAVAVVSNLSYVSALKLSASTVTAGNPLTGSLTLSEAAPAGGEIVSLTSSSKAASVPASVTVTAGATSATFAVSTLASLSSNVAVNITASSNGSSQVAALAVNAETVSGLSLSLSSVTAGSSVTGTVTLAHPAPAVGVTVTLGGQATGASYPTSITIGSGKSSDTFTITTSSVVSAVNITVSADLNGSNLKAKLAIEPQVSYKVSLSPATVTGGASSTMTVTLASAAPAGGLTFSLASSKTAVATVGSPTLTIAAGKTSGTVSISTVTQTSTQTVSIIANLGSTSESADLKVLK